MKIKLTKEEVIDIVLKSLDLQKEKTTTYINMKIFDGEIQPYRHRSSNNYWEGLEFDYRGE